MTTTDPEHKARGYSLHADADFGLRRLALWLAIGNAAGFAAAANKALDKDALSIAHLLLPACWSFAMGLLAAVLFTAFIASRDRYYARYWLETDPENEEKLKTEADSMENPMVVGLIIASAGFLVGISYPLIAISLRFVG